MNIRLEIDRNLIELRFESVEEMDAFRQRCEQSERILLRLQDRLSEKQNICVSIEGSTRLAADTVVKQVFRSGSDLFGTLLTMRTAFAPLAERVSDGSTLTPSGDSNDQEILELPQSAGSGEDQDDPSSGETSGASPVYRIQQMNVSEKMRLASRASRSERQILLRDGSPQTLMALLGNPRLEDKELLELVKSHNASTGVLQRVAKDSRWTSNYEVRLALVKNPKTPPVLAQKLVQSLNRKDLGNLAKSSSVREAVKRAALRLYLRQI